MNPEAHVERYVALAGVRFDLVRVLPGGRALEIADDGGGRFVLKWDDDEGSKVRRRQAIGIAERLGTDAGWPVPDFDLAEDDVWAYVRQNLMPGTEPTELTERLLQQVIELTEATRGLGSPAVSDWPHRLLDTLVAEPTQPTVYCSHEPLRQHGAAGAHLIERIEDIGARSEGADLGAADDLMHWDLHPGNLLLLDREISGVIDLDNAGPGPRGFDLVTFALSAQLLRSADGLAAGLLDTARSQISAGLWSAAVAHLVLRFSNWAIRTGHDAAAEYWIAEGHRCLRSGVE